MKNYRPGLYTFRSVWGASRVYMCGVSIAITATCIWKLTSPQEDFLISSTRGSQELTDLTSMKRKAN